MCNHRSECQCEPGWLPPNCDSQDLESLSPGVIAAIIVAVLLVVLGIIAAVVGLAWKRRQRPIAHTQRKQPAVSIYAQQVPVQVPQAGRPKPRGPPPPPPPAGNRLKPTGPNYIAARQALRPVPNPQV